MTFLRILLSHPGVWLGLMVSLTALGVGVVRKILKRARLFDTPNERSNHRKPIVRGGGLGILIIVLPVAWLLGAPLLLIEVAGLLGLLFFVDDAHGLPPLVRLGLQVLAVLTLMIGIPGLHPLTLLLPYVVELPAWSVWPAGLVALLAWVWWLNAFNFMDGIDGLAGAELASIALGAVVVSGALPAMPPHVALLAGLLLASAFGFLAWNWQPARIFLGDSGSVPLGLLTGYLLWQVIAFGALPAALLLPAYFLVDATGTLMLRAMRGERLTNAHSAHAYQRAVRAGLKHGTVVGRIALLNLLLLGLAILSLKGGFWSWGSVAAGYAVTLFVWLHLGGGWRAIQSPWQALPLASASRKEAPIGDTK